MWSLNYLLMKPIVLHRSDAVPLPWSPAEADWCVSCTPALRGWLRCPHWDLPHESKWLCPGHSWCLLAWWPPPGHDAPPRAHGAGLAVGLGTCTSQSLTECLTVAPHVPQCRRVVSEWRAVIVVITSISTAHMWKYPESQWLFVWWVEPS